MRLSSVSLFLALAGGGSVASAATVVVPNANTNTPGGLQTPAPFRRDSTALGSGAGAHNQIVYNASGFGSGPITIAAVSFRSLGEFLGSDISVSNTTIRLSTTAATENTLSPTFANNLGGNTAVVYSGALNIDSSGTPVFDVTINLQTPFVYNPGQGNLLLDVVIPTTATVTTNGFFGSFALDDVNNINDGIGSVTNITDGNGTTGTVSTDAAITQFTFTAVPEPASLAVLASGGLLLFRRSRRA